MHSFNTFQEYYIKQSQILKELFWLVSKFKYMYI